MDPHHIHCQCNWQIKWIVCCLVFHNSFVSEKRMKCLVTKPGGVAWAPPIFPLFIFLPFIQSQSVCRDTTAKPQILDFKTLNFTYKGSDKHLISMWNKTGNRWQNLRQKKYKLSKQMELEGDTWQKDGLILYNFSTN